MANLQAVGKTEVILEDLSIGTERNEQAKFYFHILIPA